MNKQLQEEYMKLIQQNEGIIHKVIGLNTEYEEDKKDLYQEILLQAWKSFEGFKGHSSFSTWLYRVTLNTTLNFHKKRKRKMEADLLAPSPIDSPQEDYELIYQIVKSFDEIDRMLISLHLDGYKNKEIAEITGMTSNHVNVKIFRLKAKIIEKYNILSHAV